MLAEQIATEKSGVDWTISLITSVLWAIYKTALRYMIDVFETLHDNLYTSYDKWKNRDFSWIMIAEIKANEGAVESQRNEDKQIFGFFF